MTSYFSYESSLFLKTRFFRLIHVIKALFYITFWHSSCITHGWSDRYHNDPCYGTWCSRCLYHTSSIRKSSSSSSGILAISSSPSMSEKATFFSDPVLLGLSPSPEVKVMCLLSFFGITLLFGFFHAFQTRIVWSQEHETY